MNFFQRHADIDWRLIEYTDNQLWLIQQHNRLILVDPDRYIRRVNDEYSKKNVVMRIKSTLKSLRSRMRNALDDFKCEKDQIIRSEKAQKKNIEILVI